MKKQPRTKITNLVDRESNFREIDNSEQRQLVGGYAHITAPSLSVDRVGGSARLAAPSLTLGRVGTTLSAVSTCTNCGDCDCD